MRHPVCALGLHAWIVLHPGSPYTPYYHEQCKRCRRERYVRWLSR